MAATATHDYEVNQGDTFIAQVRWLDSNRDPVPITDYTAKMQVRSAPDSEDVILELSTDNERITLGEDGLISMEVDATDMAEVEAGSYKYDLELISSTDIVTKLIKGKYKVIAEVTKDE